MNFDELDKQMLPETFDEIDIIDYREEYSIPSVRILGNDRQIAGHRLDHRHAEALEAGAAHSDAAMRVLVLHIGGTTMERTTVRVNTQLVDERLVGSMVALAKHIQTPELRPFLHLCPGLQQQVDTLLMRVAGNGNDAKSALCPFLREERLDRRGERQGIRYHLYIVQFHPRLLVLLCQHH